jgi:hypothetical protein
VETKTEKEVRFLRIYAVVATLVGAIFLLSAFAVQNKNQKFAEIDVERINIVEKDGKIRMVISNKERQHLGIIDGKPLPREEGRPAGMLFFNDKGDEMGGLTFGGDTGEGQYGSLTFDRFRGDQTIQFSHSETAKGNYFSGIQMNDQNLPLSDIMARLDAVKKLPTKTEQDAAMQKIRDSGELGAARLFIGRSRDSAAYIGLNDAAGRARIRISVAAKGNPKLEFLDEAGKVIYSLPEENKAGNK